MPTEKLAPVTAAEAKQLFSELETLPALLLAVSGGPDSVALMVLAARWRDALSRPPKLIAVTVDHGLRKESKGEAAAVARLARKLKIAHRTLRWTGRKPKTGLPQAARNARYRLLADAARKAKASHIVTAHTLDDQAETVLIRMLRGSGITGLGAMMRTSVIPGREPTGPRGAWPDGERTRNPVTGTGRGSGFRVRGQAAAPRNDGYYLVRPLLDIPKSRLIATLEAAKIPYTDDPSNRDPRFTRARLRTLLPRLAQEGLDAERLALLALRLKRADLAIEAAVDQAMALLHLSPGGRGRERSERVRGRVRAGASGEALILDVTAFTRLPAEIALRLLGRAVAETGDEGPVELGKLEALKAALDSAQITGSGFRRSLAGAIVTLGQGQITVERAPPRSGKASMPRRGNALTKRRPKAAKSSRSR